MVFHRTGTLERAIARADRLLDRAARVSSKFSRWRLAIFAIGLLSAVIPFKLAWYHTGNAALAVAVIIFLTVAAYHNRLEMRMHRVRIWRTIKQTHLARVHLDWNALPARTVSCPEQHLYAADLDIVGRSSLLRLLDTTISSQGRERLSDWLLHQGDHADTWRDRQLLIKELVTLSPFRDRLQLEAMLAGEAEVDGTRIRASLQSSPGFTGLMTCLVAETALALLTLGLLFWNVAGDGPGYWTLSFGAYAVLYMMISGNLSPVFGKALSAHDELAKLGAVFRVLERRSYAKTPLLSRLCQSVIDGPHRPSATLKQLARVYHALSVKAHPLMHLLVNAIVPWDLYWTYRFTTLHRRVQADVGQWLETLAHVEAASALATFAYLHPAYCWPSRSSDDTQPSLVARTLGHPLIPVSRRVPNDLQLFGAGRVEIITGSNMSGKSTFLRTIGINTCLAQAGGPVCAASFEWTWSRVACCIRIDDSLEGGLSFFYAEVKRLKRVLDLAQERKAPPVLVLIDEIFKGTNNRERLIGSRAYIRELTVSNAFGLVTTHDLELTDLEREIPTVSNAHFQETVENGSLCFDYRLRPGPCPTTNALRIMAIEGLPVPRSEN